MGHDAVAAGPVAGINAAGPDRNSEGLSSCHIYGWLQFPALMLAVRGAMATLQIAT